MARTRITTPPYRALATVAAVVAGAGLLVSCSSSHPSGGSSGSSGSSSSTASSSASASAGGDTIQVKNFSFTPSALTVSPGTTVTWDFDDAVQHNVTASNNAFHSSNLSSGKSFSFTFNSPGTYNYICTIHQYMKGSVTVK